MTDDTRKWTREDLIQVEYELNRLILEQKQRDRLSEADLVAADFLGLDSSFDLSSMSEWLDGEDIQPAQLILADQVPVADPKLLKGASLTEGMRWQTIALGPREELVPEYVTLAFPSGAVGDAPLFVRAWPYQGRYQVVVHHRPEHRAQAMAYLAVLRSASTGPNSPFRNEIVEWSWNGRVQGLEIVDYQDASRERLVLDDEIWAAVRRNVDQMFARMERMNAAGLGANRGMILAGPPGTGKSALCKVLAVEYRGRATVAVVSASAGQHVLTQIYRKLDKLSPALVLLEDLDLLVGDRDDKERTPLVQFLTVLDGLMTHHSGVVTIATTNDASLVDRAARRAARFDQVVEFGLPNVAQRDAILTLYLDKLKHNADIAILARESDGFSGADLREVVRAAVLDADDVDHIEHRELHKALSDRATHLDKPSRTGFAA